MAHQAPLSMEFSRQKYWSGLPLPTPDKVLALLLNGDIMQVIYQYKHQNHLTCLLKMLIFHSFHIVILILQIYYFKHHNKLL